MFNRFIKECGPFLVAGAVLLALGGYGLEYFLDCDYIQGRETWKDPAGFDQTEFWWLVVGVYFIPMSLVCFAILSLQAFKGNYSFALKLCLFYTLLGFSVSFCIAGHHKAGQVLGCGIFCTGSIDNPVTVDHTSGNVFAGLVYFFVGLGFTLLFSAVLILLHVQQLCGGSSGGSRGGSGNYQQLWGTSAENQFGFVSREISVDRDGTAGHEWQENMASSHHQNVLRKQRGDAAAVSATATASNPPPSMHVAPSASPAASSTKYIAAFAVFVVLYPVLVLACMSLPTWWAYIDVNQIRGYQHALPSKEVGYYWSLQVSGNLYWKLFPDIVLFYGMIYIVAVTALLSKFIPSLRKSFHERFSFDVVLGGAPFLQLAFSTGELLLTAVILCMLLGQFSLYYTNHGWQETEISFYTTQERAARALGQMANVCMGLLVMPVARNNIWSIVFGVSWEAMVRFHQYLGGAFIAIILCHAFTWWSVYKQQGTYPHDIFAIPQEYHTDNFTVPLAVFTTIVSLVVMVPCCYYAVRRLNYDLFYLTHHFFMIIFFMMLWHATMGWYFVSGGLLLWVADHILRMSHCVDTSVRVVRLSTEGSSHITHLSYQVYSPYSDLWNSILAVITPNSSLRSTTNDLFVESATSAPDDVEQSALDGNAETSTFVTSSYHPMHHEVGQYCFINIPTISLVEWHPFTISSAPGFDKYTSHHIRNMGDNEWTGKLYALAKQFDEQGAHEDGVVRGASGDDRGARSSLECDQQSDKAFIKDMDPPKKVLSPAPTSTAAAQRSPLMDLVVSVDGPYGVPLQLSRYSHILLVAGGIGVTPMHSYLRYINCAVRSQDPAVARLRRVRLVWNIRKRDDADLFKHTWKLIQRDSMDGLFSCSIHVTTGRPSVGSAPADPSRSPLLDTSEALTGDDVINDVESLLGDDKGGDKGEVGRGGVNIGNGRADLRREIGDLSVWGKDAVVFACGPASLSNSCSELAHKYNVTFHTETFEL